MDIANEIYSLHEARPRRKSNRLGGSLIGEKCERRIWYSFRHAGDDTFDGRILRLFETGHIQEARIIEELRSLGYTITDAQAVYTACNGHFVDKPDGVVDGEMSLEVKTMNDKAFKDLLRSGIPEKHQIQLALHMLLGGYKYGLYISINKNHESIYGYVVELKFELASSALQKAQRIIDSLSPPTKISERKDFYICKFCPFTGICHSGEAMNKNCSTCRH